MNTHTIDGTLFARMIKEGTRELNRNRQTVNDLNVFPIPDGDTGDNMFMTISGGAQAADASCGDISQVAKQVSQGTFMGARGNSGVILSRIFKGIGTGLSEGTHADVRTFVNALQLGVKESYKAVSQPVEGTILTVFREAVEETAGLVRDDTPYEHLFEELLDAMSRSLKKTPELLDVLRQAGVVDSGGAGLIYIFQGMENALLGLETEDETSGHGAADTQPAIDLSKFNENSELVYGYCTEFILQLMTAKVGDVSLFDEQEVFDYLNSVGESVVAFRDGSIIRVHVHTKTPGDILNHCQKWGEFLKLKIENMTVQHNETIGHEKRPELVLTTKKPRKKFATVTVAAGDGVCDIFREVGVDAVINGGQSMNPAVKDFLDAYEGIDADNIIVFPNNGNVILTARQSADVYDKSNIVVIPNKDLGTGYAAISMLDVSAETVDDIVASINASMEGVVTAMVSRANRDTEQDGVAITSGHYIGFAESKVYTDNAERVKAAEDLAEKLGAGDYSILMLIKGKGIPQDEADGLLEALEGKYRRTEIIPIDGRQPIHDYIMIFEE